MDREVITEYDQFPAVLDVSDIQKILNIGRVQAYELANSNVFHVAKVGRRIKVSKEVFINWLEGKTPEQGAR